ncbi:limbin-like isoform X2 [Branchiostoma lanceolatum]|uniref:limbin-like isoform X2 n=1 Tax=Branchiostoma lanceolatum TaxID=7740 RepID=UPI0034554DAE
MAVNIRGCPGTVVLSLAVCVFQCLWFHASSQNVALALDVQTQYTFNNHPGVYRLGSANLTTKVSIPAGGADASLELTLPHLNYTYRQCDPLSINVTSFNGTHNITEEQLTTNCYDTYGITLYVSMDGNDSVIAYGNDLSTSATTKITASADGETLYFDFGNVANGAATSQDITIATPFTVLSINNVRDILTFEATPTSNGTVQAVNASFVVIGPQLEIIFTELNDSGPIEAGDRVHLQVVLQHSGLSTENATNLQLGGSIYPRGTSAATIVTSSVSTSSGPYNNSFTTDVLNSGGNLNFDLLPVGETVTILLWFEALDGLLINRNVQLSLQLKYVDLEGHNLEAWGSKSKATRGLTFNDQTKFILNVENNVGVDQVVEVTTAFLMPHGTLAASLELEFQSDALGPDDILLVRGDLPQSEEVTYASNVAPVDLLSQNRRRRRKRQIFIPATVPIIRTWTVGDIVYPSSVNARGVDTPVSMLVSYLVNLDPTQVQNGVPFSLTATLSAGGTAIPLGTRTFVLGLPELQMDQTVQIADDTTNPDEVRINVTVSHTAQSSADAFDVTIFCDATGLTIFNYRNMIPIFVSPEVTVQGSEITVTRTQLPMGEELLLSFQAEMTCKERTCAESSPNLTIPANVTYRSVAVQQAANSSQFQGIDYGPLTDSVCLGFNLVELTSLFRNYGYIGLALVVFLLVGIIVGILCCFLLCRTRGMQVRPLRGKSKKKRGGLFSGLKSRLKGLGSWFGELNFASILTFRDISKMFRWLDNLDIKSSIDLDIKLQGHRLQLMINSINIQLQKLRHRGQISKPLLDRIQDKFNKAWRALCRRLDEEYQKALSKLHKRLAAKNKDKVDSLQKKHEEERKQLIDKTTNTSEKERRELVKLLDQQHQVETEELSYRLQLEQAEEEEKIRKEFELKKRVGLKELQHNLLKDVAEQAELSEEEAARIMREHKENQATINRLMDEEMSRQRMLLEEKLAQRRAMAKAKEHQEDHNKKVLNTLATQQAGIVQEMREDGKLSAEQEKMFKERIRREMLAARERHDKARESQEAALQKRLAELKKKRLAEKEAEQRKEVEEFEKKQKEMQSEGEGDVDDYIDVRHQLMSRHVTEMNNLEISLDKDASDQLERLTFDLTKQAQDEIVMFKDRMCAELGSAGLKEKQRDEILAQHRRELEQLNEVHEEQKRKQTRELEHRLKEKRAELAKRAELERQEQEKIRAREEKIVGHLINAQTAISEEDKEKILREHEKNVATLENNLTLNKLHQRRMLEEKLAQRRAKAMEKLQKKQIKQEKKRQRYRGSDSEGEQDNVTLLKQQLQERISLLSEESQARTDDDIETIRVEMLQERAQALKDQEERLGGLLSSLQMERARELATIEEQREALNKLTTNLVDELSDKGVLTDPECKKVIEQHKKDVDKLEKKLHHQRQRQEEELKKKLTEKMMQREKSMLQLHEERLREIHSQEASKTAARFKMAAMKNKYMMESEKHRGGKSYANKGFQDSDQDDDDDDDEDGCNTSFFGSRMTMVKHCHHSELAEARQKMERGVEQNLEDYRRQWEVKRKQALQEQELKFISGLVKTGRFEREELCSVLTLLFPHNTDIGQMLEKIYTEGSNSSDESDDGRRKKSRGISRRESTLALRIREATLGPYTPPPSTKNKKKRKEGSKRMKKLKEPRPDPLGGSESPDLAH